MIIKVRFGLILGLILLTLVTISGGQANAASSPTLTINPMYGSPGTEITVRGEGFAPRANVELIWNTLAGQWLVPAPSREFADHEHGEIIAHGHDFLGSGFSSKNFSVATVRVDDTGSFTISIKTPYDFAGKHEISAKVEGQVKVMAKEFFTVVPTFTVSPTSGPPGTRITIRGYGLGSSIYETNYHVLYDDKYLGYATAITTQGNATFYVYATGEQGTHYLDIYSGYPGPAYLNPQESPVKRYYKVPWRFEFAITPTSGDEGQRADETLSLSSFGIIIAAAALTFVGLGKKRPEIRRAIAIPALAVTIIAVILSSISVGALAAAPQGYTGVSPRSTVFDPYNTQAVLEQNLTQGSVGPGLQVTPGLGVVGRNFTVAGVGFPQGANVDLFWATKKGNYLTGWDDVNQKLKQVTANSSGSFSFNMAVPYDLEGPHQIGASIMGVQSAGVKNTSFNIIRSAAINSTTVKEGDIIEIRMKGVGWTFITNTATFVYDNGYIGYGCGFNSLGNVTLYIRAVGKPGLHTIDIYPTVYDGPAQGKSNSIYRYPILTPDDHPGKVRSFHFEFLITQSDDQSRNNDLSFTPRSIGIVNIMGGVILLVLQTGIILRTRSGRSDQLLASPK